MSGLIVDLDKCIGCSKCVRSCTQHGIEVVDKKAVVTDSCVMCGICVDSCPVKALRIEKEKTDAVTLTDYKNVWVFAQQIDGEILPVAYELLGKGRELADRKGAKLVAVLGEKAESDNPAKLIAYGADEVLYCIDERLAEADSNVYTTWICRLIDTYRPEIVLFGATNFGRELAPSVAVRVKTGLTADCTVLEIDDETGLLRQTRPAFGGNLMATITCPNHRPQMATVRAGVLPPCKPDETRAGKVTHLSLTEEDVSLVHIIEKITQDNSDSITKADIIVDVGKGIGSQKNLPLMKRFAELIGAKLGCSRPLVESGWCEYKHQVGQTGSAVAPKLLICIGISGAIQHLAGIGGAETIIAINSDPTAPIFGVANYSVVGDCVDIVKSIVTQLENR